MRRAAFREVGYVAEARDLPQLLDALRTAVLDSYFRPDDAAALGRLVGQMGIDASSELCAQWNSAMNAEWKTVLLAFMPKTADPACLTIVAAATAEEDAAVRVAALRSLASWPQVEAWAALWEAARRVAQPAERAIAFAGLIRLARVEGGGAPPPPERMTQLWRESRNDEERRQVLAVISDAPSPTTLSIALEGLSIPAVRAEARIAVEKVASAIESRHPDLTAEARYRLEAFPP